jgi:hypothetical protein
VRNLDSTIDTGSGRCHGCEDPDKAEEGVVRHRNFASLNPVAETHVDRVQPRRVRDFQSWPGGQRTWLTVGNLQTLRHLALDLGDIAPGLFLIVSARPERIPPLGVGQARHQPARP